MNRWFETLQQALDREGITGDPEKSLFVPVLHYAESLVDLREALALWHRESIPQGGTIRIFVDGAAKRCSGVQEKSRIAIPKSNKNLSGLFFIYIYIFSNFNIDPLFRDWRSSAK